MSVPADRKYLESHEWHKPEGDVITIGISKHAADELTDITYVQVKKVGTPIQAGGAFGEIESVKATADLISGVSGEVVEINNRLTTEPGIINKDPFGEGWIVKIKPSDATELGRLLSPVDYQNRL